jgi:hypothetical protein
MFQYRQALVAVAKAPSKPGHGALRIEPRAHSTF